MRHGPTFKVYSDHRALIYMLTTSIRTANRVVMRYILDLQEYNFSLHYKKGTLNLEADAVSRLLRYDDESIFFPKTADELRDDKGPLLTKSEHYMAKQMMTDWLWLYPEVCWRDPLGRPLQPKEVHEGIMMNDEDLTPPVPRKQRGRPRKVPTTDSVPEAVQMEQIRDVVSETMEVLVSNIELQQMPLHHVNQTQSFPMELVIGDEMIGELETCYVMMERGKKNPTTRAIVEQRKKRKAQKKKKSKPVITIASDEDDDGIDPNPSRPEIHETRARAVRLKNCLQNTPDVHPEAEKWKWLVGRVYEDFDNHRLYEVTYVYYDRKEQRACGYGHTLDDDPADPQDAYPIYCEGPECLEDMVKTFEAVHGPSGERIVWPSTESEYIDFQYRDPELAKIACDLEGDEGRNTGRITRGRYEYCFGPEDPSHEPGNRRIILACCLASERAAERNPVPVIPDCLRPLALRLYHEGLAHPGRKRSFETIRLNYVWDGMYEAMRKHVSKCRYCGQRKVHTNASKAPIQEYQIPPYPFWRCHIDITGPFVKSKAGNSYVLVLKDALSKWIELIAIPDTTAVTVAQFLLSEIYCRYGSIEELVSDRGHEFLNETMDELRELLLIKKLATTPYHPQANGMIEGYMKTLKDNLQMFVNASHTDWDEYLQVVAHCYRTTVHTATGYTPFYSIFGREAKSISNSWAREFLQNKRLTPYVEKLVKTLSQHWHFLGDKMKQTQAKLNLRPKERRIFKELRIGQQVYHRQIPKLKYKYYLDKKEYGLSKKLQYRYVGPYHINRKISPVVYEIRKENGKLKTVSIMNLKPVA